jgi:transcription initiation factor IIE alpha subunit
MSNNNQTKQLEKELGRIATLGYYNFQKVRIASMNQLRDVIRKLNEDIAFNEVEEEKEDKSFNTKYSDKKLIDILEQLLQEGKISKTIFTFLHDCYKLTHGAEEEYTYECPHCSKEFVEEEKVGGVKEIEKEYKKLMSKSVKKHPIYKQFLSKIRGIGPILSARLIKNFGDCSQYDTVSKLWAHCGYHVLPNGTAPKRRKGHEIHYSPKLKTFVWQISDSLMKLNKGIYRQVYNTEKEKQLNREYEPGELTDKYPSYEEEDTHITRGHAHNRALRKSVKIFLDHYWYKARELAGLDTQKNYVEGVLEHANIITYEDALEAENMLKEE